MPRKKPLAHLQLSLPESRQATNGGSSESPPLIVAIEQSGALRLGDSARAVTPDELARALIDAAEQNPELKLTISADKGAPWGRIVNVMDDAKAANIKQGNVSAYIKPPATLALTLRSLDARVGDATLST